MTVDEGIWQFMQKHLGYDDEEMALFRANPRNADVLARAPELRKKTIIAEVVESHACNSGHKVGDRFIFDGSGNMLTDKCPQRVCFGALHGLVPLISAAFELALAGVDPNLRFPRVGCGDVGVRCGGWGRIVLEVRAEDRSAVQEAGS